MQASMARHAMPRERRAEQFLPVRALHSIHMAPAPTWHIPRVLHSTHDTLRISRKLPYPLPCVISEHSGSDTALHFSDFGSSLSRYIPQQPHSFHMRTLQNAETLSQI